MYPQGRPPAGQPFKFSVLEICDRVKEEFQYLQAQYHSLKLECEKLASEKTEMQRHYVMYYEMSYGLNLEMHKQAEIVKRLSTVCAKIIPFVKQEHQQQILQAVERAKQVTTTELNSIIGSISPSPSESLVEEEWLIGQTCKQEEKDPLGNYDSDGDKSDYNLVVDEDPVSEPPSLVPTPSPKLQTHPDLPDSPTSLASLASSQATLTPKGKDPSLKLFSVSTPPMGKPSGSSSSLDASIPGPSFASHLHQLSTKPLPATDGAGEKHGLPPTSTPAPARGESAYERWMKTVWWEQDLTDSDRGLREIRETEN
ncbi:transducin-like enhancer protein 2 isoform X4 [Phascolarctos cinereus]|uniref:Transducin-like enhancer protein 2 isoform X4 n=1 Tax=Phascolarctos cinereus TaxID=38626 RepID=A0A6P5M1A3_PHACI|nr:transducin-like enhancer protein 2 isoform X4 [Phascolarctos cinereus]